MSKAQAAVDHAATRFDRHLDRVRRFVAQPSISATGEGMPEMATLLVDELVGLGAKTELIPTEGWPVIVGELNEGQPRTLLVYGMYDVQPVAGETWSVQPWAGDLVELPQLGACMVARGVYNSKGPLAGALSALQSIREANGKLPVNVKVLVEGEEELASRSLPGFLRAHAAKLGCDGIFGPFYGENRRGVPILKLGFKGVQFLELVCRGGAWGGPVKQDVHGAEAAWIASPAWQLVRVLASLVDEHDAPIVRGFRDAIAPPSTEDEALLAELGARFAPATILEQQQTTRFKHDGDAETLMRHYLFDPVLNLDGIASGHAGAGTKSVLPNEARAKLSARLVAGMQLSDVRAAIEAHVQRVGGSTVEVSFADGYPAVRMSAHEPIARAMIQALASSGQTPEVWPTHGGSAPFSVLGAALGKPMIFGGLGHGGKQHAPDEYATIAGMRAFERSAIELLYNFAAM